MSSRTITECGSCGSQHLESVLYLGATPPACSMPKVGDQAEQDRYPLELLRCDDCTLVQLSCVVAPEIVFHSDYPYSSGNSGALHKNFEELAREVMLFLQGNNPDGLVVDIGANDGTLLNKLPGCRTVGVEPTGQAEKITGDAYQAFFSEEIAKTILAEHGPAKVITACNVLAHVEDIQDVMRGISLLLANDGLLITENHDLASIVDGGQWDTVYHEHLRYYSTESLAKLLKAHGLYVDHEHSIPTHGGSLRTYASRTAVANGNGHRDFDWAKLRKQVNRSRWTLRSDVSALRAGGRRVGAIGASARATTIIGTCGFDVDDIEAVYEVEGSDKLGHYMPGTRIPVVDERALRESYAPDCAVLFAWYMADMLVPKIRSGIGSYKGELILPLPRLKHLRTSAQSSRTAS